jgi:hypothetical protein
MNVMRFTIVDSSGTVSFVAPCDALPALVRACAANPEHLDGLLGEADSYFAGLGDMVQNGLAIFDERNTEEHPEAIREAFEFCEPYEQPVFRVVDEVTREASLQPVKAGAVLFNLNARRIVQLQNSYLDIKTPGWAHAHDRLGSTQRMYVYRVPREWAVVP